MVLKSSTSSTSLSLSGCGFLGVYHVGVLCAFQEWMPEILNGKMAGCSAGALVAACAISGCSLEQMCSDALEIAIRARSRALGTLHPTFNIVDIIRNGLQRILPSNAHERCSGRLFVSVTRCRDNKNVIVNQFQSREELIQVLICSSFVPYWSGVMPPQFDNEYYWDGGLTNNNPTIDRNTVLISPFAGESDICPRNESGSYFSVDIRGTDVSCTPENLYRLTRALFPPNLAMLKEICRCGYADGLTFLRIRNLTKSVSLNKKMIHSNVLNETRIETGDDDEQQLQCGGLENHIDKMYETIPDKFMNNEYSIELSQEEFMNNHRKTMFDSFNERFKRTTELPTFIANIFARAIEEVEKPVGSCFVSSNINKAWSILTSPMTLTFDLTYSTIKRGFEIFHSSPPEKSTVQSTNNFWSWLTKKEDHHHNHKNKCENIKVRPSSTVHRRQDQCETYRHQSNSSRSSCSLTANQSNAFTSIYEDKPCEKFLQCDFIQSIKDDHHYYHLQNLTKLSHQQNSNGSFIPLFDDSHDLINEKSNEMLTLSFDRTLF